MSGFIEKIIQPIRNFTALVINALLDKMRLRYIYEKKRIAFVAVFSLLLLLLFFSAILLFFGHPKEKKEKKTLPLSVNITQPFVLPKEETMHEEFYLSRSKTEKWTMEEAEPWFSIPDDAMLEQLEYDNNRLIHNVLEASP